MYTFQKIIAENVNIFSKKYFQCNVNILGKQWFKLIPKGQDMASSVNWPRAIKAFFSVWSGCRKIIPQERTELCILTL